MGAKVAVIEALIPPHPGRGPGGGPAAKVAHLAGPKYSRLGGTPGYVRWAKGHGLAGQYPSGASAGWGRGTLRARPFGVLRAGLRRARCFHDDGPLPLAPRAGHQAGPVAYLGLTRSYSCTIS